MRWELAHEIAKRGTERCQFLVEALDLEAATDFENPEWEAFQLNHLNDDGQFRIENKSRQVGWSWLIAAESVADSTLVPRTTHLLLSINREESAEKIRYARQIYEALYPQWRVPLVGDAVNSLVFANGARIIAMPQRPARGKPKGRLYLDEFAHYRLDKDIYTAGVPVTTKGGYIRIGSTALGARGMFWEIAEQRRRSYPGYTRVSTPWWTVVALLAPHWRPRLREVTRTAPEMATEDRVAEFANDRIKDIYANLPLDDFQQEYECAFVDEALAYISWDDIMGSMMADTGTNLCWLTRTPDGAFDAIDELSEAVESGKIGRSLAWGLDIGRKRDLTELIIVEIVGTQHITRAILSLDRQQFQVQYDICRAVLEQLPVVRGFLDQNGLGMQLVETLSMRDGYGERAMPMVFTAPTKALMATHLKTRFQRRGGQGGVLIPADRDLSYQIHSVRRRVTGANNVVFDVEHSERHHADKFWALALANEAAESIVRERAIPRSEAITLRTTHRLRDALDDVPLTPDYSPDGMGLTREQLSVLVAEGVYAAMQRWGGLAIPEGALSRVVGNVVDADTDGESDVFPDEDFDD